MPDSLTVTPLRSAVAASTKSMRALAAEVGMSPTALHRRMTGEVALNVDEIHRLAAALAIDPAVLLVGAA